MTVYSIRWHEGLIDSGCDTRDLDVAVRAVKTALSDGFSHVVVKTRDVAIEDFWREIRDAQVEAREMLEEKREGK